MATGAAARRIRALSHQIADWSTDRHPNRPPRSSRRLSKVALAPGRTTRLRSKERVGDVKARCGQRRCTGDIGLFGSSQHIPLLRPRCNLRACAGSASSDGEVARNTTRRSRRVLFLTAPIRSARNLRGRPCRNNQAKRARPLAPGVVSLRARVVREALGAPTPLAGSSAVKFARVVPRSARPPGQARMSPIMDSGPRRQGEQGRVPTRDTTQSELQPAPAVSRIHRIRHQRTHVPCHPRPVSVGGHRGFAGSPTWR